MDDLVAAAKYGSYVDVAGHGLDSPGNPARLGKDLPRTKEGLRGHAGIEGALASDKLGFDDRHLAALLGYAPGKHLPGWSGADNDHVIGLGAHHISDQRAVMTHRPKRSGNDSSRAGGMSTAPACLGMSDEQAVG